MSVSNPPLPVPKPVASNKLAALDMLGGSFMSGGLPSIQGGNAAPAISEAVSGHNTIGMNNSFSVAGNGGTANASGTAPTNQGMSMIVMGVFAFLVLILGGRR